MANIGAADDNHMGQCGRFISGATSVACMFRRPSSASAGTVSAYAATNGGSVTLTTQLAAQCETIIHSVLRADARTGFPP